jgi:hypothetical protein
MLTASAGCTSEPCSSYRAPRFFSCVGVLLTVLCAAAVLPASSSAVATIGYLTRPNSSCSGRSYVDPVNWMLRGAAATADNSWQLIENKVGWDKHPFPGPSEQWLFTGHCHKQDHHNKLGRTSGHHTRDWQGDGLDSHGRYLTVGDAHRERFVVRCPNDAVYPHFNGSTGFDQGQNEMFRGLVARYIGNHRKPHKRRFKQCTGEVVAWNGVQDIFVMNVAP